MKKNLFPYRLVAKTLLRRKVLWLNRTLWREPFLWDATNGFSFIWWRFFFFFFFFLFSEAFFVTRESFEFIFRWPYFIYLADNPMEGGVKENGGKIECDFFSMEPIYKAPSVSSAVFGFRWLWQEGRQIQSWDIKPICLCSWEAGAITNRPVVTIHLFFLLLSIYLSKIYLQKRLQQRVV